MLLLYATENSFQNTLLKLDATANPSDSFNFLEIVSGSSEVTMFTIEGDGDITVAKGDVKILTGELSLYSGLRILMEAQVSQQGVFASSPEVLRSMKVA